jgi:N-dimethylarginine dimethylaminohydrolase
MSLVSVHNEWDPLEEVIVGVADAASLPRPDRSLHALEFPTCETLADVPGGPFDERVIEETREDLAALCDTLTRLGVRVRRPEPPTPGTRFATPDWESDGFFHYCPRDVLLAIGDGIIEAPSPLRARYFESFAYRALLIEYLRSGSRWIAAPRPRLLDSLYDLADATPGTGRAPRGSRILLNDDEPAFDAANVLRIGRDILYLVSSSGNELGHRWLAQTLGPTYRVHACRDIYVHTHIDSTITVVRPGLVVLNAARVTEDNLPPVFRGWDKIWCREVVDQGFTGAQPYATIWIGMNFLMVNPGLAIIDAVQTGLIRDVERHGIDVAPLRLRHARTLGGGFHCVTLDVRRRGTLEDYTR